MGQSSTKTAALLTDYAAQSGHVHALEPSWVLDARALAWARFNTHSIPTTRLESWKYTTLRELSDGVFVPQKWAATTEHDLTVSNGETIWTQLRSHGLPRNNPTFTSVEVALINGTPTFPSVVDVPGLRISTLSHLWNDDPERLASLLFKVAPGSDDPAESLVALNTALFEDGIVVEFLHNAMVAQPVHLLFCGAPPVGSASDRLILPRVLVVAHAGSVGTVVESHVTLPGVERQWSNPVVECVVDNGAVLHHIKVQAESPGCFHTAATDVRLSRGANYRNVVLTGGGGLVRNDLRVTIDGPHAEVGLYGATLGRGRQHIDHHTQIDHRAPDSTSEEVYRTVADDNSHAVFSGTIIVRQDAQKTNARQTNNNLLLSQKAHVDTKPELLIYADDVKCAHGATVGELDELSRFYLRARGISDEVARGLLLAGFLREVTGRAPAGLVQNYLQQRIAEWLPHVSHGMEDQP